MNKINSDNLYVNMRPWEEGGNRIVYPENASNLAFDLHNDFILGEINYLTDDQSTIEFCFAGHGYNPNSMAKESKKRKIALIFSNVANITNSPDFMVNDIRNLKIDDFVVNPDATKLKVEWYSWQSAEQEQLWLCFDAQHNGILGLYSDVAGTNTRYYTHSTHGDGPVVGQIVNGAAYYFLTDLRGSIVKVTDINGNVQNTYEYDPYGTLLHSTGSVQNPWRYAGAYYDWQTGLYKMGARYYNSTDARWTQLDPSGAEAGYVYAAANPVNLVDPSGYAPLPSTLLNETAAGCVAGGVSGGVGGALVAAYTGGLATPAILYGAGAGCALGGSAALYDTYFGEGTGSGFRAINDFLFLRDFR